mmetsp:Transcript_69170/g.165863  ORF Transcript_69170/g.165863 Transcript_69170/m.165863 type:complete len:213 (-) Transcript_69170:163-801(-)
MSAQRFATVMQRFNLTKTASVRELRKAYYKEAKRLHPDIVGEGSADAFKQLQSDYDEALRYLENPPSEASASSSSGRQTGSGSRGGERTDNGFSGDWRSYRAEWTGTDGEHWNGYEKAWKEQKVDFDPGAFRSRQTGHAKQGSGSYNYTTSGRSNAPPASWATKDLKNLTPAQVFRFIVLVSGSILSGSLIVMRLGRSARANQGRLPYAAPA